MKKVEFLYLSQEDIMDFNLDLELIISLVEKGLKEHGMGNVENPPKPGIHSKSNSIIHAMPAYFKKLNIGGIKWVSGYPDNRQIGLPQMLGLIILNDMSNGLPLCVMDCRWITAVRTAAVTAVTAKYCAKKDASTIGIVGCGVQGRYNLMALKRIIPNIGVVKIYDIDRSTAERYKKELSEKEKLNIRICESAEQVAVRSDIILTATQRLGKPLIKNEWFGGGCLGFGLEASRAWYGDAILKADKFITDDWAQTKYYKEEGAFPDGLPRLYAELGEVVTGKKPGRESEDERILAINIGLALVDIIVADYVYNLAKTRNKFRTLTLMEKDI